MTGTLLVPVFHRGGQLGPLHGLASLHRIRFLWVAPTAKRPSEQERRAVQPPGNWSSPPSRPRSRHAAAAVSNQHHYSSARETYGVDRTGIRGLSA